MTPEQQRIAIAEACGWRSQTTASAELAWARPGTDDYGYATSQLSDYLSDLNAMHEAEKALSAVHWDTYRRILPEICTPMDQCSGPFQQMEFAIHATAAQRAEAFLRTIGKWTGQ